MNGGSTFLIRICKELMLSGEASAVLILRNEYSQKLRDELEKYAEIIFLQDYIGLNKYLFLSHLTIFAPIKWERLNVKLNTYKQNYHIMSALGLCFAARLTDKKIVRKILVGVYHQNEFLYQDIKLLFPRIVQKIFKETPPKAIVFFNENTKKNYNSYFEISYKYSIVSPIGIEINSSLLNNNKSTLHKIISIGNLDKFKTYNFHMIKIVASLLSTFPNLTYTIYGSGTEMSSLKAEIIKYNLQSIVTLAGELNYSEFNSVVSDADLFVGSGSALLEAAALGVPAMIGIESITTPETYGFLSDVIGFDYNEFEANAKKFSMHDLIKKLLLDRSFKSHVGSKCAEKAKEFSITVTCSNFFKLNSQACTLKKNYSVTTYVIYMFSLAILMFLEVCKLNNKFSTRRNQSFL